MSLTGVAVGVAVSSVGAGGVGPDNSGPGRCVKVGNAGQIGIGKVDIS